MHLLSVNIGVPQSQPKGSELEITGIYKSPAASPIQVTPLGLAGDFIADKDNHGGPDQAVFVYGGADYAWWADMLGRKLPAGTFGENLTISDLESARFNVGDRLQLGSVVLEVTSPRTPCSTLARRMGDPMFVKRYRRAERPGLYCRVIREGSLRTGDEVAVETGRLGTAGILEIFREHYALEKNPMNMRRFLQAPIAERLRADLEKRLRRMSAAS